MRRRKRAGRQMTALECTQAAAIHLLKLISGGEAPPRKKRRNRGAARRAKLLRRERGQSLLAFARVAG